MRLKKFCAEFGWSILIIVVYLGMDFYNHHQYKDFETQILKAIKGNYNILIYCLLSADAEFFIKKFIEKHKKDKFKYITRNGETLVKFNFLNMDFNNASLALNEADSYLLHSNVDQKLAVVINNLGVLNSEIFRKSVLSRRYYTDVYIKNMDLERAKILAVDCNVKVSDKVMSEILEKTGGIAILTKYFVLNLDKLNLDYSELLEDAVFKNMLWFICEHIAVCNQSHLVEFGIKCEGEFTGSIIREYFKRNQFVLTFDISMDEDGHFREFGLENQNIFLKIERNIILKANDNKGMVTKEEISDIKWGKDSYDEYSDQAIKKTIQRINKKLEKHVFVAIPTIGYRLTSK